MIINMIVINTMIVVIAGEDDTDNGDECANGKENLENKTVKHYKSLDGRQFCWIDHYLSGYTYLPEANRAN